MEHYNQIIKRLDTHAAGIPQIMDLSKKIGQPPGLILLGLIVVGSIFVLVVFGVLILTLTATVVFPALQSIRALESKDDDEDDKQWLSYWTVYGFMHLSDDAFGWLFDSIIPYYGYLRVAMFIWMMLPQTKGALWIYKTFLSPLLKAYQPQIENFINDIKGSASEAMKEGAAAARQQLSDPSNMMKGMEAL
jgi:receptor expression-enhancing protein 5/6